MKLNTGNRKHCGNVSIRKVNVTNNNILVNCRLFADSLQTCVSLLCCTGDMWLISIDIPWLFLAIVSVGLNCRLFFLLLTDIIIHVLRKSSVQNGASEPTKKYNIPYIFVNKSDFPKFTHPRNGTEPVVCVIGRQNKNVTLMVTKKLTLVFLAVSNFLDVRG